MSGLGSISALAALGCGLLLCVPAAAQRGARGDRARMPRAERAEANPKKTPIDEFETLSPAEQQRALNRLPEAQRQQPRARLDRFNALPADQQQAPKSMYNRLHQLPPQPQEAVRKAINKFSPLPGDRQQAVREELRSSEAMSSQQRPQELDSPGVRSRFSKKEQEILRDMSA